MGPDAVRQGRIDLGRQLAALRKAAGYTQDAFAPKTLYGRSTIANVETGGQRAPREFWQRCDRALGTGGILTRRYDDVEAIAQCQRAQDTRRTPVSALGSGSTTRVTAGEVAFVDPEDGAYVGVERAITVAARQSSEHAMTAGALAVSDISIDQLRDDATHIARDFGTLTPAEAIRETLRVRDLAVASLGRTGRPAQQHELYLITAQAVALLASASVDLGMWAAAMQYARAADTYGEIISHAGVRAYAKGMQATVAYWTGQPEESVRQASAAVALAPGGTARVRALSVLARAWSHRGADDEVERTLAAAAEARGDDGDDLLHDVIGGEFGFGRAQQARCASTAWLQVDRPAEATTAAAAALEITMTQTVGPWATVAAEARVDLATCHLSNEAIDACEDILAPLWSMPPDWRRTGLLGRLNRVQVLLSTPAWRQAREARQVTDLVAAFLAQRPAPPALPSA